MEDTRHPDEIPLVREAMTAPTKWPLEKITPHPLNEEIYGDRADDELIGLIRKQGLIHPILITGEGMVISGHRRFDAVSKIGYKEVPVVISPLTDPLEIEETLIEANRQRQPSNEQLVREYVHLKRIEERRLKTLSQEITTSRAPEPEVIAPAETVVAEMSLEAENVTEDAQPTASEQIPEAAAITEAIEEKKIESESRQRAAKRIGKSTDTLEKGLTVIKKIDEFKRQEKVDAANELSKKLNEKSVSAAYRDVVPPPEKPPAPKRFPLRKVKAFMSEIESWTAENTDHPASLKIKEAMLTIEEAVDLYNQMLKS